MSRFKYVIIVWLPLMFVVTALCGLVYTAIQQNMRMSANDPQIQLVEDTAMSLALGANLQTVIPPGNVTIENSLAPFIAVYDDGGRPLLSSGTLHGKIPNLPQGIFNYVRQYGEDRVTWQPEPGVRQALILTHYSGQNGAGFVASGRSLKEVERREVNLNTLVISTWVLCFWISLIISLVANYLLNEDYVFQQTKLKKRIIKKKTE